MEDGPAGDPRLSPVRPATCTQQPRVSRGYTDCHKDILAHGPFLLVAAYFPFNTTHGVPSNCSNNQVYCYRHTRIAQLYPGENRLHVIVKRHLSTMADLAGQVIY